MARTYRRKHYTPSWVTQDTYVFIDPRAGVQCRAGHIERVGDDRARELRWWHEDKSCWWGARPPKPYRQEVEAQHRMSAKSELNKWWKNEGHDVLILSKGQLGYWD